jgi:hypothetical protein
MKINVWGIYTIQQRTQKHQVPTVHRAQKRKEKKSASTRPKIGREAQIPQQPARHRRKITLFNIHKPHRAENMRQFDILTLTF